MVAVVFDVKNMGTNVSGVWNLQATLPTDNGSFTSPDQPSINPGDLIRFTLQFDRLQSAGTNTATILIDPSQRLLGDPRQNNMGTATIFRL